MSEVIDTSAEVLDVQQTVTDAAAAVAAQNAAIAALAAANAAAEEAAVAASRPVDPLADADLDRTRDYGELHGVEQGTGKPVPRYTQDGKLFDARGKLIVEGA